MNILYYMLLFVKHQEGSIHFWGMRSLDFSILEYVVRSISFKILSV